MPEDPGASVTEAWPWPCTAATADDSPAPTQDEPAVADAAQPAVIHTPSAPTTVDAFTVFAAAALGITDLDGWDASDLNTGELEHVVAQLNPADYDAWFDGCSRELRAILRNGRMSPRQRRDRAEVPHERQARRQSA